MLRVGLMAAPELEHAAEAVRVAARELSAGGAAVACEERLARLIPDRALPLTDTRVDVLVALGGDGTVLRAARAAVQRDVPLLGVNLGTVGFLAEVEPEGLEGAMRRLLRGDFTEERRNLLEVRHGAQSVLAMNDAVISRGGYPRMIRLQVLVDGQEAGGYRADGLVVATPTGSTGYSLSAGGPIVAPGVDAMLVTPICAHSLQHRPLVLPGDAVIQLQVSAKEPIEASLQVDGVDFGRVTAGDRVEILRGARHVRLIRMKPFDFFGVVRRKLTEWTR